MKAVHEDGRTFDTGIANLPFDQRLAYYLAELRKIIEHAYRNAPAVRDKWNEAGFNPSQFKTIRDLRKIPVIKKEELKAAQAKAPPFGRYLGASLSELQRIYVSPGPIYDPEARGEKRSREAMMLRAQGLGAGDRVLVTLAYHMVPAGLLFDKALREIGALVIPAGAGGSDLQAQVIKDLQVTGYIGTATFLMNLIRKATDKGYRIPEDFPIRTALLTAERVLPALRKTLEEDYHISTWEGYGTADIGMFAYECNEKSGMHLSDDVYVEIIDPKTGENVEPGEVGEVVVTHFNPTYPLIRFGTSDLSSLGISACACGRTSPRLVRIVGRVGDSYKVRGLFIYGSQIQEAVSAVSGIANYCMVIDRPEGRDELTLKVEPVVGPSIDLEALGQRLQERIKEVCGLKMDHVVFVGQGILDQNVRPLVDARAWE